MECIQRRSHSVPSESREKDGEGREAHYLLDRLRRSFLKFRRTHSPRTRIPHALRDMAILALDEGASKKEVLRACRVTSSQLAQWKKSSGTEKRLSDPIGVAPRIYPVIDEVLGPRGDGSWVGSKGALELRLGEWAICIRPRSEAS